MSQLQTAAEVAHEFRCSVYKVTSLARHHGIGSNFGGSAGWRFTEADKAALLQAMTPAPDSASRGRLRKGRRAGLA